MADRQAKVRDFLVDMALRQPKLYCFESSGKINATALARDLGIQASSTVRRMLKMQRNVPKGVKVRPYHPGAVFIDGVMAKFNLEDEEAVWEFILNAPPPPENLAELLPG